MPRLQELVKEEPGTLLSQAEGRKPLLVEGTVHKPRRLTPATRVPVKPEGLGVWRFLPRKGGWWDESLECQGGPDPLPAPFNIAER